MIEDIILRNYLKDQVDYRVKNSKKNSLPASAINRYFKIIESTSINNGIWKVILKGKNSSIRKIEKGSLPKLLNKIDNEYYSSNSDMPKYNILAKVENYNIELPLYYWSDHIRNKEEYIAKYSLNKANL
ncbi:MAG TPA: hypothetical protein VEC16_01555 [Alphaproteobacteria bacterium]|nr:hypothetical protein [Alphaproteobacteria bacterium]